MKVSLSDSIKKFIGHLITTHIIIYGYLIYEVQGRDTLICLNGSADPRPLH